MKVAINGFGRIGRLAFRELVRAGKHEVVAINDLFKVETLAYLLEFDSAQGRFMTGQISSQGQYLIVGQKKILVLAERNPEDLPWQKLRVDVVIEATGLFRSRELASRHLTAGAKKVVISAPAGGDVPTIVFGVNHHQLRASDRILSCASCTTNCATPLVHVLDQEFGVVHGLLTTVHAVTNDQRLLDLPHQDMRRGRSALVNIVPTQTGAAVAITKVLPHLAGRLNGIALRVPVVTGSIVDFTIQLKKPATATAINQVFQKYAQHSALRATLDYARHPLVSCDVVGATAGSIFDPSLTLVLTDQPQPIVKVFAWYDNETSYMHQLVRTVDFLATLG